MKNNTKHRPPISEFMAVGEIIAQADLWKQYKAKYPYPTGFASRQRFSVGYVNMLVSLGHIEKTRLPGARIRPRKTNQKKLKFIIRKK